ncbi:hypothetical protein C0195_02115 [Candidatus Bathyarchaeota archaeon]|nr:MAG: hypothetical protein C0195_02115 [Candidatus Bathyarchaeota archaeon]
MKCLFKRPFVQRIQYSNRWYEREERQQSYKHITVALDYAYDPWHVLLLTNFHSIIKLAIHICFSDGASKTPQCFAKFAQQSKRKFKTQYLLFKTEQI